MVVILREVIEMDFTTLQKAMIDAMKARDKARKDSIAVLVSAAKKLAIDSGCREDIPDEMVDQFADVIATKNKGQIMKAVMSELKGKADGKVINAVVAEMCK